MKRNGKNNAKDLTELALNLNVNFIQIGVNNEDDPTLEIRCYK